MEKKLRSCRCDIRKQAGLVITCDQSLSSLLTVGPVFTAPYSRQVCIDIPVSACNCIKAGMKV